MKKRSLVFSSFLFFSLSAMAELVPPIPHITSLSVDGEKRWEENATTPAKLSPGELLVIEGKNLGLGVDADYSKILFGNIRALERELCMYRGVILPLKQLYLEKEPCEEKWTTDFRGWSKNQITVRVPMTASQGPLVISIQNRIGNLASLFNPLTSLLISDPLTERIDSYPHLKSFVSLLSDRVESNQIPLEIDNENFEKQWQRGEAIYWAFDFNIGLVHKERGLDWNAILSKKTIDPVTGKKADPKALFGALPLSAGDVPEVAKKPHYFNPYPAVMPIHSLVRPSLKRGWTYPTGYVGRVYAEAIAPVTGLKGSWAGENCASCHTRLITYETETGETRSKFFAGLPNPGWSEKWTVLGNMKGVIGREPNAFGRMQNVDKTLILYHVPNAATENALVRTSDDGSRYGNDHLFAPVVIPTITRHTPLRRVLSRTEMIAGFEGSYIHAEEPDGAVGPMRKRALQDLTVYLSTLDRDDETLRRIALYRWYQKNEWSADVQKSSEGQFLKKGPDAFPAVSERLARGKAIFSRTCEKCHDSNFGTWTDERMVSFQETGTYFSPSIFHREVQSIRTSYLRNLYWVQDRGLLHDGHVKNLSDLVHPGRCREGSELYQRYYELSEATFHIPKGKPAQERALRAQAYFVDVPWDSKSLYWDYQKMRTEFGKREFGLNQASPLPAAPHPWCVGSASEVDDLVTFLVSL